MKTETSMRLAVLLLVACLLASPQPSAQTKKPYQWTKFVQVDGQPEPVPAEWVETPEGKFAHSIKIPNPVPKDSGYRWTMSAKEYFDHLCKDAGTYIFKTAKDVEGILFMRPPRRPTDGDLKDRRKLEAPSFERVFQLMRPEISERGVIFGYRFAEEPNNEREAGAAAYLHASTLHARLPRFVDIQKIERPRSQYGVTWRGLRREKDRENAIAGTEIIVLDLSTNEVMGVLREYGITGRTRKTREGIWWLNAAVCPQFAKRYPLNGSRQLYEFVSSIVKSGP
jgi:hypothetical protein